MGKVDSYKEQRDYKDALYTVRCDLPRAEQIDSLITVTPTELPNALRDLAGACIAVDDWGEAPTIIEVRRVK